jgi:hypothetical protein
MVSSNGAVVALRAPEDTPAADAAATPTAAAAPAPPPAGPDARAVSEEVYKLLAKRSRIERERTGVQRWR